MKRLIMLCTFLTVGAAFSQETTCGISMKEVIYKKGGRSQICKGEIQVEGKKYSAVVAVSIPADQRYIQENPVYLEHLYDENANGAKKNLRFRAVENETLNPALAFCIQGDGKSSYSSNFHPGEWESRPKGIFGYSLKVFDFFGDTLFEVNGINATAYENSSNEGTVAIPLKCE